jgi:hypothetical protein
LRKLWLESLKNPAYHKEQILPLRDASRRASLTWPENTVTGSQHQPSSSTNSTQPHTQPETTPETFPSHYIPFDSNVPIIGQPELSATFGTSDSAPLQWPPPTNHSIRPRFTEVGATETSSSWAGSPNTLWRELDRMNASQWPAYEAISEHAINAGTLFNFQMPSEDSEVNTDEPSAERPPNFAPQPSTLYPMFLGDSTAADPTWMPQSLYERVAELVSHCRLHLPKLHSIR